MESDSDDSSNMNGEEYLEDQETDNSDEDSIDSDDDSGISFEGFDANEYYQKLMEKLRQNDCSLLQLWHRGAIALVLENVDEFCTVVANAKGIKSVELGDIQSDDATGPKLEITENSAAWNKILLTFGNIYSAEEVVIGGFNLGPIIMTRLVQAMQNADKISVFFPWRTVSGDDMRPFVEALSSHSCAEITLCLSDKPQNIVSLSPEPLNHFQDNSIFSQLLRLEALNDLWILETELTFDEFRALGDVLVSNACCIESFRMDGCPFPNDESVNLIGNAIGSSPALKVVIASVTCRRQSFHNALISSLPRTDSIKRIHLTNLFRDSVPDSDKVNVADLIRSVARHDATIEVLHFSDDLYKLPEKDIQELQPDVQRNYSLEMIKIGHDLPFEAVNILNAVGRSYLQEDSTSNSKCIALLAKVKDELDCLYYHMRENPILCMTYCSTQSKFSGNKRKADSDSAS
jgi:hypothetical protein